MKNEQETLTSLRKEVLERGAGHEGGKGRDAEEPETSDIPK